MQTADTSPSKHEEPAQEHTSVSDHPLRKLKSRHIQLIGIGGAIGTVLFVQIGAGLVKGGPGFLLVGFILWSTVVLGINNCLAEMVTWMPLLSPFARFSDHFVDPALGFCAGMNFFIVQSVQIPFEIVAFTIVWKFWTDEVSPVAIIAAILFFYLLLNIFAVQWYGESEFWLASGKVLLAIGLMSFTLVTMSGGNPLHEAYGFRYWDPSKIAGTPFAAFKGTGHVGRLHGFLGGLIQAAMTIVGPEYISMAAGETRKPRHTLPIAYRSFSLRLAVFFVGGAACVGTVVSYSDSNLVSALSDARPGAGSSPYVIAMQRMRIPILPHIVNVLILTSIFSAGNSYVFCASRSLYGLALEGKVPKLFLKCSKSGVPIYCVFACLAMGLLAFLQVANNTAIVLQWLITFASCGQMLVYAFVAFTYLRFHKALKVQGISRHSLPHRGIGQPFWAYYSLCGTIVMALLEGYAVFLPGNWDLTTFIFSYAMLVVAPLLFLFWKIIHRTKMRRLEDMTFFDEERKEIDKEEKDYVQQSLSVSLKEKITSRFSLA